MHFFFNFNVNSNQFKSSDNRLHQVCRKANRKSQKLSPLSKNDGNSTMSLHSPLCNALNANEVTIDNI